MGNFDPATVLRCADKLSRTVLERHHVARAAPSALQRIYRMRRVLWEKDIMPMIILVLSLLLANVAVASAQMATPDSENGRYSFSPLADGVLRLDTRTGQVSQCSRSDAGWACNAVPDERSALETEIARLQGENATVKKELLARGLPVPGVSAPSGAKAGEPEIKLPSDAEIDKVVSFVEKVWRRLIDMGRKV